MLLILVILCLSQSSIVAAPTAQTNSGWTIAPQTSTSEPQVLSPDQQRTLWDIVKSCLVTIFACSWVSVHPNIPPPNDKWWMGPLRRLELMTWAIIAPELIILWAMRQWIGAKKLATTYDKYGWTRTHGHFYQMGGFKDWRDPLDCPWMTKEEIQDHNKADGLSKALVIIHTLWFVMQCIVRRVKGLYITELELATAGFAVLNGVMYFLWWDKPLAVQHSLRKQSIDKPREIYSKAKPFKITVSDILLGVFLRLERILDTAGGHGLGSTFYADTSDEDNNLAAAWASVAGIIFGAIHCAGWFLQFPSHLELMIWRVSSIVVISLPLLVSILSLSSVLTDIIGKTCYVVTLGGIPFYIIARLLLLVEAFTTLRELPPGAYEVVRWTTFIPHI